MKHKRKQSRQGHKSTCQSWTSRWPDRIGPALALLAASAAVGLCGCKKTAPAPPPPPMVQVMDLTPTNVPLSAEFIGQLDSPQNIEVRARVEAFVEQMPFAEGTEVKTGELLFKLDDSPYRERLAAAKGSLGEAEAALKKYQADVDRLKPLAEKRAVPRQDLDNALASVDVGKASVFSAQARVESALLDLSYCEVRAATNGLIGAKQVSIGELVGKGTPTLMATISTLDPMWFYCNIGEAQFLRASDESHRAGVDLADLPITLILANGQPHSDKGKFVFFDRAVDIKTGTLRVRAEFPNPPRAVPPDGKGIPAGLERVLRPGMFGRIRVDVGVRSNSIVLPEKAVTELQGKNFVWVIDAENKPSQRPVKVGEQVGEGLLIREGLKGGERIVVEGLQKLREGVPVKPMTAAQMAEAAAAEAAKQAEAHSTKEGGAKHGKE